MNIQSKPLHIYQNSAHVNVQSNQIPANVLADNETYTQVKNSSPKTDSVDFSTDARLLAEANRVAMQGSEGDTSRADKIARLKSQVQSGTYQADEKGIAEGLVREESHLFIIV